MAHEDPWLARWLPLIGERAASLPVLELGCGGGRDSEVLVAAGHHFGASGHPRIDDDYYMVDGEPKRFFDRAATERLFARGWRTLSLEEGMIDRYECPKWVWETILEKTGLEKGD